MPLTLRAPRGNIVPKAAVNAETAVLTKLEERNSETVRQMVAYLSSHNVAGMLSCFDPEMEWLDVPMEASYRGNAEIRFFFDSLFGAFPDIDYRVTHIGSPGHSAVPPLRVVSAHR